MRYPVPYDACDPLPPVRTAAGDLANPFATVAKRHRQCARLLALAFAEATYEHDVAGILRAVARAVDFSLVQLAALREGPHFMQPGGVLSLPFELVQGYAILHLAAGDLAKRGSATALSLGHREVLTRDYARHFVGVVMP